MSKQYGIFFNKDNCIQCYGCEVACKSWRNVESGVKWRGVENIWHGTYPDIMNYSASIACMHCAEPACVEACPEEAITKRAQDGIVVVAMDKCTGCRLCLDECPFHIPAFGEDDIMQKCDLCLDIIDYNTESPPCVQTCPTKALTFGMMDTQEKIAAEGSMKQLVSMIK